MLGREIKNHPQKDPEYTEDIFHGGKNKPKRSAYKKYILLLTFKKCVMSHIKPVQVPLMAAGLDFGHGCFIGWTEEKKSPKKD